MRISQNSDKKHNLYKKLLEWENVIKSAYQKKEVHLIAHYLESL